MENNKETAYKGFVLNGFLGLILVVALIAAAIYFFVRADSDGEFAILGVLSMALFALCTNGFVKLEPNEAMVLLFFGKYRGTFTQDGFYWVNPLLSKKKVSLRARNLNPEPIKVNDKVGNPVLIGMVLVWKLEDTYKALFEIDSQSLAPVGNVGKGSNARYLSQAFENFVRVQSRQQADAIIAAREKIVDGAVSMVKMALDKLKAEGVVDLDEGEQPARGPVR